MPGPIPATANASAARATVLASWRYVYVSPSSTTAIASGVSRHQRSTEPAHVVTVASDIRIPDQQEARAAFTVAWSEGQFAAPLKAEDFLSFAAANDTGCVKSQRAVSGRTFGAGEPVM